MLAKGRPTKITKNLPQHPTQKFDDEISVVEKCEPFTTTFGGRKNAQKTKRQKPKL